MLEMIHILEDHAAGKPLHFLGDSAYTGGRMLEQISDTRGRDTDSMQRPEESLQYWKLLSEELACFDSSFPFATDHSRLTYFRSEEPNPHYVPHENFSARVTMMSGLPGSGKDTWLAMHRSELPVVSLDAIRKELGISPTGD